jgi:hypothetical protein
MIFEKWWKLAALIILAVILDAVAHQLAPELSSAAMSGASGEITLEPSALSTSELFGPILLFFLLLAFGVLAFTFLFIKANLPYGKWRKGLWYGVLFGGIWYIGMFESVVVWGNPFEQELFMGLADAVPIFLFCLLLGGLIATDPGPSLQQVRVTPGVILGIGFFYLFGRYVAYAFLEIESAYLSNPLPTALWTLGIGVWIGLGYWRLRAGVPAGTPLGRATLFGGVVYGLNWLLFIFFMPLLFHMDWRYTLLRIVSDVIWVTRGVFVVEC